MSDPSAHMGQKVAFALKKRPDLNQILKAFNVVEVQSIEEEFEKHFSMPLEGRVERIEHQHASALSVRLLCRTIRARRCSFSGRICGLLERRLGVGFLRRYRSLR